VAASSVGDLSKAIASCVNLASLNIFVFFYTKHKVYNEYHMTQITIDTLLNKMTLMRALMLLKLSDIKNALKSLQKNVRL
jgi:hypothetical protein